MPFVEIRPVRPSLGTGVRLAVRDRGGAILSLSGEALAVLAGAARVRVLFDADPALPRLNIVADPAGPFALGKPPLGGDRVRLLRLGHRPEFGEVRLDPSDCMWEADGGIEIDLPRELRSVAQVVKAVTVPSTSQASPRTTQVTLPAGRVKERV